MGDTEVWRLQCRKCPAVFQRAGGFAWMECLWRPRVRPTCPAVLFQRRIVAGLFGGNGQIVSVALTQLGNEGGQKFWSWYGFDSHVAWCACFASWCGDQAGLIKSGKMPKFSLCDDGIAWFQSKGKWKSRGIPQHPEP